MAAVDVDNDTESIGNNDNNISKEDIYDNFDLDEIVDSLKERMHTKFEETVENHNIFERELGVTLIDDDISVSSSQTLSKEKGLKYPKGLKHRDITSKDILSNLDYLKTTPKGSKGSPFKLGHQDPELNEEFSVKDRLLGLPGRLGLTPAITNKYFGENARSQFYERYHYVKNQKEIQQTSSKDCTTSMIFDYEEKLLDNNTNMPFQPSRSGVVTSSLPSIGTKGSVTIVKNNLILLDSTTNDSEFSRTTLDQRRALTAPMSFEGRSKKSRGSASIKAITLQKELDSIIQSSNNNYLTKKQDMDQQIKNNIIENKKLLGYQFETESYLNNVPNLELDQSRNTLSSAGGIRKNKKKGQTKFFVGGSKSNIRSRVNQSENNSMNESTIWFENEDEPQFYDNNKTDFFKTDESNSFTLNISFDNKEGMDWDTISKKSNFKQKSIEDDDDMSVSSDCSLAFQSELKSQGFDLGVPSTPRTKYIENCCREKMNPRISLMVRKNLTKCLAFQHQGMGDKMAKLLASSLQDMPFISSINISDNNLTDEGLVPLLDAILGIKTLLELDLSQNVLGPLTAAAMAKYIASPTCSVEKLTMQRADVDDFECERFVSAIGMNKSLVNLDLSYNLIGGAENLNTVMPDLITGGEAIADLLRNKNCKLISLNLSWNLIRLDGAVDLASSLSINKSLIYLDLSYNSLGTNGGEALGDAIQLNTALETINVSNNSLDTVACLTICIGVIENRNLRHLIIDENPIGEQGAKAIMLIPTLIGSRLKISCRKCNIAIKDPKCFFDSDKVLSEYALDLSKPFERAVAITLLYQVASHPTYRFSRCEYDAGFKNCVNLDLQQIISKERMDYFDDSQKSVAQGLMKIVDAAKDIDAAKKLFTEIDLDGSGALDGYEFSELMTSVGIKMTEERAEETLSIYDSDGGGTIGLTEFLAFLKVQKREAEARLKDLVDLPVMAAKSNPKKRYLPPREGTLYLTIFDGFSNKPIYRILSACDRQYIAEVAEMTGDSIHMLSHGVKAGKMRLDEGLIMAHSMLKESTDKVLILSKLLPLMNESDDCRSLISRVIKGNKIEFVQLRIKIGLALRPMMGVPDGYYLLDLSNEMDRYCITRLIGISQTINEKRQSLSVLKSTLIGDFSQKKNWTCFRNERLNGEATIITKSFASPLPKSGKLEFDFVSGARPKSDDLVINNNRFCRLMLTLGLLKAKDYFLAITSLDLSKSITDSLLKSGQFYDPLAPVNPFYIVDAQRATDISEAQDAFYSNIEKRSEQYRAQSFKEELRCDPSLVDPVDNYKTPSFKHKHNTDHTYREAKVIIEDDDDNISIGSTSMGTFLSHDNSLLKDAADDATQATQSTELIVNEDVCAILNPIPIIVEEEEKIVIQHESDESESDESDDEENHLSGKKKHVSDALKAIATGLNEKDEGIRTFRRILAKAKPSAEAKASRLVDQITDYLQYQNMTCRQLALLLNSCFKLANVKSSEFFGTYRVEIFVFLFARLVDIHNIDLITQIMTPFEMGCIYCRIGWSHIFNPLKIDGAYELELNRKEERQICKMLCILSTKESGNKFLDIAFKWQREMAVMPGLELTELWLTDAGLPDRGIWSVFFKSAPRSFNFKLRRSFLAFMLIDEQELFTEEEKQAIVEPIKKTIGALYMLGNQALYDTYIGVYGVEKAAIMDAPDNRKPSKTDKKSKK